MGHSDRLLSWAGQALKDELDDPVGVLASLVSSTVSLGLPRASGHLYLVGQLLTNASHDLALATALGNACFGRCGDDCDDDGHLAHPQAAALGVSVAGGSGGDGAGVPVPGGYCRGGGGGGGRAVAERRSAEQERLGGFGTFLASHALSASCQDHVKSDVLYVALELLDCCTTAGASTTIASLQVGGVLYLHLDYIAGGARSSLGATAS